LAAVLGLADLEGAALEAAVRVLREPGAAVKPARQMFAYSVLYLFLIFTLLIADRFALALAVRPFGALG
jgi:protoheme IX farnesyltransferase